MGSRDTRQGIPPSRPNRSHSSSLAYLIACHPASLLPRAPTRLVATLRLWVHRASRTRNK